MRVLVTGASGFLGGAVCAELRRRDHEVAALVRRPGSHPPDTEPVAGDLGDEDSLARSLDAAAPEGVIHLAAEIASQRSAKRIHEVNVGGTERLLRAAERAGARRIVFTSTVVTGEAHGALLSEDEPLPVETPYGRSKQEGERVVHASPLESVVLRPSHVYGAGGWYAEEFVNRLRAPGRFAVIGRGDNLWDVVRVEDVASACVAALDHAAPGTTYHVADDRPITFHDFIALTAEALGTGPPRHIPAPLARLAAGRHAVTAVTRSARSSNARIKRELGWTPRFPTAHEGVPDAIAQLSRDFG